MRSSSVNFLKTVVMWIAIVAMSFPVCSCSDDEPTPEPEPEPKGSMVFIGDSLIDNWTLENNFPGRGYINLGLSGANIHYIQKWQGRFQNDTVVVMIGTNDLFRILMQMYTVTGYADIYWDALEKLGASRIYLYSLIPRGDFFTIENDYDSLIPALNEEIKKRLPDHSNVIYMDVYDKFLDNGKLIEDYYWKESGDLLHVDQDGYDVLAAAFEKALAEGKPGDIIK